MPGERTSILFVCMGNICRSPLAEGVFRAVAESHGHGDRFHVDSAGTGGWHAGERPDPRVRAVAKRKGVKLVGYARQVHVDDFARFDHLICMDDDNRQDVLAMGGAEKVTLLLEHDPKAPIAEVPDPYYGAADGFEMAFNLVDSACRALLEKLVSVP